MTRRKYVDARNAVTTKPKPTMNGQPQKVTWSILRRLLKQWTTKFWTTGALLQNNYSRRPMSIEQWTISGNISDTKAQQIQAECQSQQATGWQVTNFSHKTIEGHVRHSTHNLNNNIQQWHSKNIA